MFEIRFRMDMNTVPPQNAPQAIDTRESLSQLSSEIHHDLEIAKLAPPPPPQNANSDLSQAKMSITDSRASLLSELKSVLKFKQLID